SKPNQAHYSLVDLEKNFDIQIITQNIDDLHERAGSKKILHLHGEILKAKSSKTNKQHKISGHQLNIGDLCKQKHQLRPDIVWFGEAVPNMVIAEKMCRNADILIIIGTSLTVYPAANIIDFVSEKCKKFIIDPKNISLSGLENLTIIKEKASIGIPILANNLLNQ
ncbi:NAD-dependent deacylase, partial [Vicingaceae bacterium]|nr:NAD-dependent deacylase [Vicingaceae bacterium]